MLKRFSSTYFTRPTPQLIVDSDPDTTGSRHPVISELVRSETHHEQLHRTPSLADRFRRLSTRRLLHSSSSFSNNNSNNNNNSSNNNNSDSPINSLSNLSDSSNMPSDAYRQMSKSSSKDKLVPPPLHEPLGRTRSSQSPNPPSIALLNEALHDPLQATNSSPSEIKRRASRRSVKREQYYGSVEAINNAGPVRNTHRFRLEPGSDVTESPSTIQSTVMVENPQSEIRWYWKYFLGNVHQNLAGIDPASKSPFFISILVEDEPTGSRLCRSIVWQHTGPKRMCIPFNRPLSVKAVLQKYPGMSDYNRGLREIHNAKIQKDLIVLEDQEGGINCKFGVIFARSGQSSDVEMLANEHGDGYFESFLGILGQRIQLNGWGNYKGGLDTITNSTGRESVYTTFASHEIMFHVSTLLPHSHDNVQQVERKRHIGNDIVNIVFEDAVDPKQPTFSPTMMKSHFTHVFAVVTYDKEIGCYRLWVYSEKSVPAYGPPLPYPNEFYDLKAFREFLLTKVINGEKAALQAKAFVEKRQKTNDTLINDMYLEYLKDCSKGLAQMIIEPVVKHNPTVGVKEEHGFEFVKYGELIKLEKTLSGDVAYYSPKKLSLCRKQPWEPQLLFTGAPYFEKIISADSWGELSVLTVTPTNEVYYIESDLCTSVFEATAEISQIYALEEFGLFIAKFESGKDSGVCVFPLSDLKTAVNKNMLIPKLACHNYRIANTRGASLFTTTDPFGLRLSMIVAIGKRMLLFRWAFGPLGPIEEGTDVTKNWTQITEVSVMEEPTVMSAYEVGPQGYVKVAFVTRNHGLNVVDMTTGEVTAVKVPTLPKGKLRGIIAIADGNDEELLYTYDNVTVTSLSGHNTEQPPPIFWTSNTNAVVYRFPFVIGFAHDMLEVRLAINGNLLSSIYMPGVKLLASKHDIVFAAERQVSQPATESATTLGTSTTSPSKPSLQHKHLSMCTNTNTLSPLGSFTQPAGSIPTKAYDLYSIPAKNLVSRHSDAHSGVYFAGFRSPMRARTGAGTTGAGGSGADARKVSGQSRDFEVALPGGFSNVLPDTSALTKLDNGKPSLHGKESLGSDSGVGNSQPHSFETSQPSSPLALKDGDTLL